ncbi:MAG: SBBP repeat-containing protein [Thermoplasmata archaeon]|nr:MAG: SBBP repeat-containing protein [Thermoplasmata archaeon]
MTRKRNKTTVHVIVVISLLSMVHLFHFWEPQMEGVALGSKQTETGDTYPTSTISSTDFWEDGPEFDLSDMDLGHFTENLGQWEDHIRFLAQSSFGYVTLGPDGVSYYVIQEGGGHVIKIVFQDGGESQVIGRKDMGFDCNYFYGNQSTKWVTNARSYEEVLFKDVWPGIDILYYFTDGNLKYDIIVGEFSDPGVISFGIQGHCGLDIKDNELKISISEKAVIRDTNLVAFYQDGTTVPIQFKKTSENTYGFEVKKAEGRVLTIDPVVFSTSTFLGGSNMDMAKDLVVDRDGNIIILGEVYSTDFPNTTGAFQTESAGPTDMTITKIDPHATQLIFSTYIGGYSHDFSYAMDVDDNGDIYATGETWARNFPTTNGTFQEEAPAGSTNVFVVKLASSGSDLIYSTYVGSSYPDWGRDIKIFNGYAYVVGYTYSYDFPYVGEPINNAHGTTFFFILNQDASNLTHTAFWGGAQNEMAYSLAIDTNGDVVVGGTTNSMDFPITPGVYQEIAEDWHNGFLVRYRPSTSTLLFSTYIGGTALDVIWSIYLDENSDIYFSGITNKPGIEGEPFPTTPGAYDRTMNGSKDAFIGKMSSDGSNLIYSTFLGGEGKEEVGSIDVDNQGNVYFIGSLDSGENFSVTSDAFDDTYNGENDTLFAVLNSDGSDLLYCTYLGGNASDFGRACILSASYDLLILGNTDSYDFPVTNGSYQTYNKGPCDIFLTKFSIVEFIFLNEGWNLISLPLIQMDTDIETVLSPISGYYDAVAWYDAFGDTGSSNLWKHHHTLKQSHLNELKNLNHIRGFWIHITEPGGVFFKCSGVPPKSNQYINLHQGWNMVGYPSLSPKNRTEALYKLQFGTHLDSIWTYDAKTQEWNELGPSDYFEVGRGYWIHAKVGTFWEVPL